MENDDCKSGFCSIRSGLKCSDKLADGEICVSDDDCESGDCDTLRCSGGAALSLVYSALMICAIGVGLAL